jgi:hypothetical protein
MFHKRQVMDVFAKFATMDFLRTSLYTIIEKTGYEGGGVDSSGSGEGPVVEICEHGNEPSGSIKCV